MHQDAFEVYDISADDPRIGLRGQKGVRVRLGFKVPAGVIVGAYKGKLQRVSSGEGSGYAMGLGCVCLKCDPDVRFEVEGKQDEVAARINAATTHGYFDRDKPKEGNCAFKVYRKQYADTVPIIYMQTEEAIDASDGPVELLTDYGHEYWRAKAYAAIFSKTFPKPKDFKATAGDFLFVGEGDAHDSYRYYSIEKEDTLPDKTKEQGVIEKRKFWSLCDKKNRHPDGSFPLKMAVIHKLKQGLHEPTPALKKGEKRPRLGVSGEERGGSAPVVAAPPPAAKKPRVPSVDFSALCAAAQHIEDEILRGASALCFMLRMPPPTGEIMELSKKRGKRRNPGSDSRLGNPLGD